ncbi:cbb3-type cytochrome c oxidase subunit I, partial [bacterium]|nr:cbb3-type cytochrome c oxidase subunit I [bacterium]
MHTVTESAADAVRRSFLGGPGGFSGWFNTTDHKRISLMFLAWTGGAFVLAMILALLPLVKAVGGPGLGNRLILETLTYQRLLQVFAWLVPVLPMVLGYFLLPLQIGAANTAFPGMGRWSLRSYVVGLVLLIGTMATFPVGTGWTLDSHLSLLDPGAVALLLIALFCMGLSWFLTGINFVVTVHHGRREGLGFFGLPFTAWGFYLYGYLMTAAGGVFAVIVLYLAASRVSTVGLFGWQADPMVWRTYFWFAVRPLAYFVFIPAVGIVSDVIGGMARRTSPGYRTLVGSMIALTGLALAGYGAGLFGQGISPAGSLVFSVVSLAAAVPIALISFVWLSTLYRGSITCGSPLTFSVAFILHAG